MSTENPMIPIFQGLEGFEELMSRARLRVRSSLIEEATSLEPGSSIRMPSTDLRKVGLELVLDWEPQEVLEAANLADLGPYEVAFVVVAEDGFLKERTIVAGPVPAPEAAQVVKLAGFGGDRPAAMMNSGNGFNVEVYFVLSSGQTPRPLQPHRKGTILGSATFGIKPTRDSGGLDPKPLTAELIEKFDLSPKSLLYLDYDGPIVELEHLDGALDVYVNEQLLVAASKHRGDERDAILISLAVEAMCQLVHVVSRELETVTPPEGDNSAVLRMIRRMLSDAGRKVGTDEIADLIKNRPLFVTGLISGHLGRAQQLLTVIAGDNDNENGGES